MLEIRELKKSYQLNKQKLPVLEGIDLTIQKGEFVMIMGESGSGKSTFLNCISSLDQPTEGQVILHDQNILAFKGKEIENLRLKSYGFIFQDNHLIPSLTVLENIAIARLQYDKQAYEKAKKLADQLGIGHLMNNYPHQVSGGEKQRASIARALINDPEVLFADEPTASLNPNTALEIMRILQELNDAGQTIVMVTHSKRIASYGKRLLILVNGMFTVNESLENYLVGKERYKKVSELVEPYL